MSMTSLSICTNKETVNSKSALFSAKQTRVKRGRTRFGGGWRHVHKPVQVGTEQTQQRGYGTTICKVMRITSDHPGLQPLPSHDGAGLTLVSKFLRRLLKSDNSGEVIKIMFNLITIILANSRSYSLALDACRSQDKSDLHHPSPRSLLSS